MPKPNPRTDKDERHYDDTPPTPIARGRDERNPQRITARPANKQNSEKVRNQELKDDS